MHLPILTDFLKSAEAFGARHPVAMRRTMSACFTLANVCAAAAPFVRNGFIATAAQGHPDWALLTRGLAEAPVPFVCAGVCIGSSFILSLKNGFAKANAGYAGASFLRGIDCLTHGEPWTAATFIPTVLASLVGAKHHYFEEKYGASPNRFLRETLGKPQRFIAGVFAGMTLPLFFTSALESGSMMAAAVGWLAGDLVMPFVPSDGRPNPKATKHAAPGMK